jgi:hypothetical protein
MIAVFDRNQKEPGRNKLVLSFRLTGPVGQMLRNYMLRKQIQTLLDWSIFG